MVTQISQFHRIQGSKGYLEATQYIQSIFKREKLDSTLFEFPADGIHDYWGWIAPISWDISFAECWLIKPFNKRLSCFDDIPMSVLTHSKPADFTATLIDGGRGDNPEDYIHAKEKIVMVTASPRKIFPLAARYGVKGLILHPDLERAAKLGDNIIQYDGFWPIAGNLSECLSGFSISHKQARELIKYLNSSNEVQLQFKIDAKFSKGKLHVLETDITGSIFPEEEIILIGHLCHPAQSANDNASGSASLAELAIKLSKLIETGALPYPKRTLRFLWVPEFSGTIPWIKQYENNRNGRKIIAALNLDMVGERNTPLRISSPSIATPSYLDALVKYVAEVVSHRKTEENNSEGNYQFNFRIAPFEGGSDHLIFNDQFFSIPSVMFGHEDPFHHSTADSLEKIDSIECKNVSVIAGSVAYAIATADSQVLHEVLSLAFLEGIDKIIKHKLELDHQDNLTGFQKVRQGKLLEKVIQRRLGSISELDRKDTLNEKLGFYEKSIKKQHFNIYNHFETSLTLQEEGTRKFTIKRNFEGPTSLRRFTNHERLEYKQKKFLDLAKYHWGGIPLEFLNLADNIRSIEEIFLLLKLQYPKITYDDVIYLTTLFQEEGLISSIEM
jgi:hypothetical protein